MEDQSQLSKAFLKKTRRGKVVKLVREKYLRDDVDCGFLFGKKLSKFDLRNIVDTAPHQQLLILDTNIAIQQIDVLEYKCPSTSFVVILQTVLQEVLHLNLSVYRRITALLRDESKSYIFFPNELSQDTSILREPMEIANDYNDRSIRRAVSFFQRCLSMDGYDSAKAILLTNDKANMKRGCDEGLHCFSMQNYMLKYLADFPELLDLLAVQHSTCHNPEENEALFEPHLPVEDVLHGIKNKKFYKGILRCCSDNRDQYYVIAQGQKKKQKNSKEDRMSISIQGSRNANRAIDGDVVAVEVIANSLCTPKTNEDRFKVSDDSIIAESTAAPSAAAIEGLSQSNQSEGAEKEQIGKVVGIIRRNWRQFAGTIVQHDGTGSSASDKVVASTKESVDENNVTASNALFIAVDSKIPPVKIVTRRLDELLNKKVLVAIDMWTIDSEYPTGHYIRTIGDEGNKDVETAVLLHEFGVPCDAFSAEVMSCLPSKDWKITDDIIAKRTDLRHIPVVSIDPPGCKDIDDALHCVRLPNGNFEVGVHIADVSHFVEVDSPLDKEAAHRSTSTYLVQRRLDMLPGLLTTELCSLRSHEDHLAFSVIWEVDEEANIIDAKFFKSCIHSVASMTYDEAQAILDAGCPEEGVGGNNELDTTTQVELSVHYLNRFAKILRKNRIDRGALTLASPEVRFKFEGESDNPTDVSVYNIKDSNQLVEEFMLLANITVSKKILRHYPTLAILRRHQPPSEEQFRPLLSAASAVGVQLDIRTSKTLADSLDKAVRPDDPFFNKLMRILSTRCMMPAQYFCSGEIPTNQWHHYGLAAPVYTHFTSPIRRYADLVVHRLLAAAIGVTALPVVNADRSKQQDLCSHMNRRHRSAQHIQRASCALHTILYFRSRPSLESGYVLSVFPDRIGVIVPKFGVENTILMQEVIGDHFAKQLKSADDSIENMVEYDADAHKIVIVDPSSKKSLLSFQVFQKVQVDIRVQEGSGTVERSSRRIAMSIRIGKQGGTSSAGASTPSMQKKRGRDEMPSNEKKSKNAKKAKSSKKGNQQR